jgi:hypothetical protein
MWKFGLANSMGLMENNMEVSDFSGGYCVTVIIAILVSCH